MAVDVIKVIHDSLLHDGALDMAPTLRDEFGTQLDLTIELGGDPARHFSDVDWIILSERASRLVVSPKILGLSRTGYMAARLTLLMPLIIAYHDAGAPALGQVNLNVEDFSPSAGLGLCGARPDAFLIPDTDFLRTKGYADFRDAYERGLPAWSARRPTAFWRGSTTGLIWSVDTWRDLPRIRLCAIARERQDIFDAGVSNVVQIEAHAHEIKAAGLMRPPVPALEWCNYRYQIDVDGNSNAWAGFFQRLLTGSPVLKAASPSGFRQWFYHRLQPWVHYVPVAADMSDIVEKVEWLNAHEGIARLIGQEGRRLACSITYESEMPQAVLTVAAAIHAAADADVAPAMVDPMPAAAG